MTDTCVIKRQTDETEDDYGRVTPIYTTLYAGKCRVQAFQVATSSPDSGQTRVDLLSMYVHVPIAVTTVEVNDLVDITASRDPDLPGVKFRVDNRMHKTDGTARRIPVEERTS